MLKSVLQEHMATNACNIAYPFYTQSIFIHALKSIGQKLFQIPFHPIVIDVLQHQPFIGTT